MCPSDACPVQSFIFVLLLSTRTYKISADFNTHVTCSPFIYTIHVCWSPPFCRMLAGGIARRINKRELAKTAVAAAAVWINFTHSQKRTLGRRTGNTFISEDSTLLRRRMLFAQSEIANITLTRSTKHTRPQHRFGRLIRRASMTNVL